MSEITFDALKTHGNPSDRRGAQLLADHIQAWWHERGFYKVAVEWFQVPGQLSFGVRSNLVNGLPPL